MNRFLLSYAAAGKKGVGAAVGVQPLLSSFQHSYLEMSFIRRVIWHSRAIIRYHLELYGKKYSPELVKIEPTILNKKPPVGGAGGTNHLFGFDTSSPSPLQWLGQELQSGVRKLFVDNVLRRVTSSLSGELRKKASQRLLYGNDARPFFALVGVSLASGTGMLTKENEFEGICWEIRESLQRKKSWFPSAPNPIHDAVDDESSEISVNDLNFGPLLSKGACAAVYAANWKNQPHPPPPLSHVQEYSSAAATTAPPAPPQYPLAVKMMFNYDFESNASTILRAMSKEIVPVSNTNTTLNHLKGLQLTDFLSNLQFAPPHPNIIEISHVFTDQIPMLPESLELFPAALPPRLNQDGYGRNMSLFLIMKCYDSNLESYLRSHPNLSIKQRLLLLTQLLEGISHLNSSGIAHRDLKLDNILLDTSTDLDYPHLTITDFGCCLADKSSGLHLPFPSYEIDRGGNAALMAPEIANAKPGTWKKLSYEKSDAWAVGSLGYEIFGARNPFVRTHDHVGLDSRSYTEAELPNLVPEIPNKIQQLLYGLLRKNPSERLSAELGATICQLYLWAPTRWLTGKIDDRISDSEIMQWLLTLTTKVLCKSPEDTRLEFSVIRTFLQRLKFMYVKLALDWIHVHVVNN